MSYNTKWGVNKELPLHCKLWIVQQIWLLDIFNFSRKTNVSLVILGRKEGVGIDLCNSLFFLVFYWVMHSLRGVNFCVLLSFVAWYLWMSDSTLESVGVACGCNSSKLRNDMKSQKIQGSSWSAWLYKKVATRKAWCSQGNLRPDSEPMLTRVGWPPLGPKLLERGNAKGIWWVMEYLWLIQHHSCFKFTPVPSALYKLCEMFVCTLCFFFFTS